MRRWVNVGWLVGADLEIAYARSLCSDSFGDMWGRCAWDAAYKLRKVYNGKSRNWKNGKRQGPALRGVARLGAALE